MGECAEGIPLSVLALALLFSSTFRAREKQPQATFPCPLLLGYLNLFPFVLLGFTPVGGTS